MFFIKRFIFIFLVLCVNAQAQNCDHLFQGPQIPSLETLEKCRDITQRQARRFERPVFQTQLQQDLIERLIYVISQKETCFYARESFFKDYGIKNRSAPQEDMNEELSQFWTILKKACPNI